jgi:putative phosphoesterase
MSMVSDIGPLAIVSDIHGNLTALEAVIADIERRGIERVVHGGDLALVGCQPVEVVDRVRALGWPGVVGNTDELLWCPQELKVQERKAPKLRDLLGLLFEQYAPATTELLGEERIAWLRGLPAEHSEDNLVLVHASPGDLWHAPSPDARDAELRQTYESLGAEVVVYGHIHIPFIRRLDRLTVVNLGSVGSPLDGDPRASYLLIDDGEAQIIRVAYDVEAEIDLLLQSGYPDAPRIAEMRRLGKFVPVGAP